MSVKLLREHHLEFLSLKEGYVGLSESTLVKMPHCWKSHIMAHIIVIVYFQEKGKTPTDSFLNALDVLHR